MRLSPKTNIFLSESIGTFSARVGALKIDSVTPRRMSSSDQPTEEHKDGSKQWTPMGKWVREEQKSAFEAFQAYQSKHNQRGPGPLANTIQFESHPKSTRSSNYKDGSQQRLDNFLDRPQPLHQVDKGRKHSRKAKKSQGNVAPTTTHAGVTLLSSTNIPLEDVNKPEITSLLSNTAVISDLSADLATAAELRIHGVNPLQQAQVSSSIDRNQETNPKMDSPTESSQPPATARYNLRTRNPQGQVETSLDPLSLEFQSLQIREAPRSTRRQERQAKTAYAVGPGLRLEVPVPTKEYMEQASMAPKKSSVSQKLLIVIDLNGTLLCRTNNKSSFRRREHLEPFLKHLLEYHSVMIWSSSMPANMKKMVDQLFTVEERKLLVAQWGRDTLRLTKGQYTQKVQVYKQLQWIWESGEIAQNWRDSSWSQTNTVLIDDSVAKGAAQPFNLLQVPEFEGKPEDADVLGQTLAYIEWVKTYDNVSAAMKATPFKANGELVWEWQQ
jgi:hypothetical protein